MDFVMNCSAAVMPNYVAMEENGTEVFHSHSNITVDHREYLAFSAYSASKSVVVSYRVYSAASKNTVFEVWFILLGCKW